LAVNLTILRLTYPLDNPIANQLLVRQLQRYKVNVVPTTDGDAAFKEWEKREPGFFTFALFDHRTFRLQHRVTLATKAALQICPFATALRRQSGCGRRKSKKSLQTFYRVRFLAGRLHLTPDRVCSVIALSADCQESTKELCLSAGMNGFLTKPMRPGRLSGTTV